MGRHGENIRKRKDGRWEARLLIGHTPAGKANYRYFYGKSYKEAKEKRRIYKNSLPQIPEIVEPVEMTLSQLLHDWLYYIYPNVKESTYAKYVFNVERHIEPELGSTKINALTTGMLDDFSRNKLTEGKITGSGGLAPKTVNSLLSIIKLSLKYGLERNYPVPSNLVIHNVKQPIPEIHILSLAEQKRLEGLLTENMTAFKLGILISLYTGLRIGEVCGLKWGDIHFDSGTLIVQRTVMRIQNKEPNCERKTKLIIDRPKTDCSNRTIPLPGFLLEILETYKKNPDIYITSDKNTVQEPRCFYIAYKRLMKRIGLDIYNYHALRHTFATRCIEQNFDVKSLSEILGHSDVNITLKRYVHPSMDLKRQQMERLTAISFCGQNFGHPETEKH